ncbi:glycosyltransferase family 39 protein [Candidatus Roizmanbacteria bacterium]|nr:MAG: glycosyltransferase family 39 protein [Candidatus Roizmanbacteria bacterium]
MRFSKSILSNIVLPITLLIISAGIVFYQFPSLPQNIALDEVEFIKLARSLENAPYAPYSQLATGHATLYFYMLLASIRMFGETVFAVRFPSALFGVIDVLLLYGIFKLVFEERKKLPETVRTLMPFFLAFTFITMRWYFNFARFGFEASTVLFFELAGIYSLFLFRKTKSLWYVFWTGIAAGLAYNSYTPGRIFFILPLIFLIWEYGSLKQIRRNFDKPVLLFIIPFLLLIIPLNLYFTQHDDNRIYELFYLQNEQLSLQEKATYTWQNVTSLTGMFFVKGDMNGRHNYPGKPMLNPIQGILLVGGIIVSLYNWKKYHNSFFLLYFVLGMLPPMMTYPWENPNALRSVTVLPSVVYFIGQALVYITRFPLPKKWILLGIFVLLSFSAIYELRTYFVFQKLVFPEAFELNTNLIKPYLEGNYFLDPNKPRQTL